MGLAKKSGVLERKGGGKVSVGGVSVSGESGEQSDLGDTGESDLVMGGGQARIVSGTVFQNSVSVFVRSQGKNSAHVEIRQTSPGATGERALVTELDLPLGTWRTIGGVRNQSTGGNREALGRAKSESANSHDVQIKVEPQP